MPSRTAAALTAALVAAAVLAAPGLARTGSVEPPVRADGVVRATTAGLVTSGETADPGVVVEEAPLVVATEAEADPSSGTAPATVDPGAGTLVADALTPDGRVETDAIATPDVQTIGVTWPAGADPAEGTQVRTRDDGTWSDWQELDGSDIGPDAGTVDAAHERDGTDSFWIGDADAVQLSFAATSTGGPDDMSLTLVGSDPVGPQQGGAVTGAATSGDAVVRTASYVTSTDGGGTDGSDGTGTLPVAGTVRTGLAAPRVITRAEWSARPQVCAPDVATTLVGAVLHHTAGSNTYASVAEAMQQIRNDQAYHIDGRGWCDIGYNFVVDKWGNIYEGRANSLTQPVIGVHAGGFNTGTVGVSMLGEFGAVAPPPAMQEAVSQIIGYRLGAYGRNPNGMQVYTTLGGENSRFAAGTTLTMPVVFGHRDVAYTACPGNLGYATLPGVRVRAQKIAFSQPLVRALYHDMLQRDVDPTGLTTWTAQLMAGTSASVLGDGIAHSAEYVQRRVTDAYMEILGRGVDATGMATWSQAIMSGRLRVEDLRGQLIASDEYFARAGGTNEAYVARLYRDILHREAGPGEIASWSAQIRASGRGVAPVGVWRSLESAQLRIHETYAIYLDRPADTQGLATWAPYWQANGEDALRAQVIGSDEYLGRSARLFS